MRVPLLPPLQTVLYQPWLEAESWGRLVVVAPTVPSGLARGLLWPHLFPTGKETVCTKVVSVKIDFEVPGLSQTLESDVHVTKMNSFLKCALV